MGVGVGVPVGVPVGDVGVGVGVGDKRIAGEVKKRRFVVGFTPATITRPWALIAMLRGPTASVPEVGVALIALPLVSTSKT